MNGQELEVKFYVASLDAIEERLRRLGAQVHQPRTHEVNLRFDTPEGRLGDNFQVLRLRQDTAAVMTYKGPGEVQGGVRARREIEFQVSDLEAARQFLEALGYQVVLMYEKFRAVYALEGALVTLDEMPYGEFVEIEGPDPALIASLAAKLGLDWEKRVLDSYVGIFDHLRFTLGLTFRDLSFENFAGVPITSQALGVSPAG